MSKRNKGKNAFYFFMEDWRTKHSDGHGVMSLKEASADPRCSEEWKSLTPPDKAYYENKAKDSKIKAQASVCKKTTLGESISEIEAQEKKEQEFQQNMFQYIDSVISMGIKHKNLPKIKFIFVHANWFFRREIGINKYEFCPAEFAVGEFSLEEGLQKVYHEVLNVKIPLGWRRDAIETSQQTHKIPIELEHGQSDFLLMYNNFIKVLETNKTGNRYPPVFTTKDMTLAVESLLVKMTEAANESIDDFQIYTLEALFGALRNAAAQNVNDRSIPLVVAENAFAKDVFSSVQGIECNFHKLIDGASEYCSKSAVTRWGFTICDYCCEYLDIDMVEGVHRPSTEPLGNDELHGIDSYLDAMKIGDHRIVEMNGVSADHRMRVSERTYRDEQRRRNQCKPLEIIDHGKFHENRTLQSSNFSVNLPTKPLRPPSTISKALYGMEENIPFCSNDFPPIGGRGVPKKKTSDIKFPLGRGRGKP